MSAFDRAYSAIKTVMLSNERFDRVEGELKELNGDISALAGSHADLAEKVAEIEGYLKAATGTSYGGSPRLGQK